MPDAKRRALISTEEAATNVKHVIIIHSKFILGLFTSLF